MYISCKLNFRVSHTDIINPNIYLKNPLQLTQSNKKDKESNNESSNLIVKLFVPLATIMNKVGISGFVVIALTVIVFSFSTSEQKHEIIDAWILFKSGNTTFYIILGCLIFLMIGQRRFQKKTIKLYQQRNLDLENQITELASGKLTYKSLKKGGNS